MVRPAMWVPGLNKLHSHRDVWFLPGQPPAEATAACEQVLRDLADSLPVIVAKSSNNFVRGYSYTKAEWLDVIELRVSAHQDGSMVKAVSFSSGFLPTAIPLAPLLNMVRAIATTDNNNKEKFCFPCNHPSSPERA